MIGILRRRSDIFSIRVPCKQVKENANQTDEKPTKSKISLHNLIIATDSEFVMTNSVIGNSHLM